jgi:predicted transcriptional regulator
MKKYQPNFSDPRVIATTKRALNFVALYTKDASKVWISRNELYKHFGNTSRPLGQYLKQQLLIEADSYYNPLTGTCKKYMRNAEGMAAVEALAGLAPSSPTITPDLEQQITSGVFDYEEKSNRLYNPLQFIPKQVRGGILANHGYKYHYDIEAAAPTLLIQRAQQLDKTLQLVHLEHYTQNRSQVREQIAQASGVTTAQVKTVINGVLQGGALSCWQQAKIYRELNYDYRAIQALRNCQSLTDIRKDITKMWATLKQEFPQRYISDKSGRTRSQRLSAKDKSGLYRELENQVGVVIRRLLKKKKIQCLWIHDGWCCDKFIDPSDVELEVRRTTGYSLKLEWNKYEDL